MQHFLRSAAATAAPCLARRQLEQAEQQAEQQAWPAGRQAEQAGRRRPSHLTGAEPLVLAYMLPAFPQPTRSQEEAAQAAARPPPPRTDEEALDRRLTSHRRRMLALLATLTAAQLLAGTALLPAQRHCLLGMMLSAACALLAAQADAAGLAGGWRACHLDHVWPLALLCALTQLERALSLLNPCQAGTTWSGAASACRWCRGWRAAAATGAAAGCRAERRTSAWRRAGR
jgi:hypothetical protein